MLIAKTKIAPENLKSRYDVFQTLRIKKSQFQLLFLVWV